MPRSTMPSRSTSPPALAAPGTQLPAVAVPWGRNALMCLAAGLAGLAVAMLAHEPVLGWLGMTLSVPAALAIAYRGRRRQLRLQLADRLLEAVAPLLGLRSLDRRAVVLRRWGKGSPGVPKEVLLHYAAGRPDSDPQWRTEILEAVQRRLLDTYAVGMIDHQRCVMRLEWYPPLETAPAPPVLQQRAERAIAELIGPTAVVTDVVFDGEDLVAIEGRHQAGAKLAASGYRARIERVVSTMLPGRWRAQWDLEADRFRFEVRPTFPSTVWMPPAAADASHDVLGAYDSVVIPYGVDEDGEVMVWRPAIDPNLMLVGSPGTGKTVAAHGILTQITGYGWPVWVVDGKSIEFLGFQDWPNVQIVGTTIGQQIAIIHRAWEVMERRYELITSGQSRETDFEPLVLFLDEWADFRGNLMSWYAGIKVKGDPTKPLVLQEVSSIGRKGRTARVHLVFGTQRPDAEYFGGDMRDNFRMRISMGRLSPQGAMMMWENPVTGTSLPRGCRGRATTINDDNRAVEIQTYRTPDPRKTTPGSLEADLLDQLRPATVAHERLLIVEPTGEHDLDSGDIKDPTYTDFACAPWVRAADRPDLDPVASRSRGSVDGRSLASPMTVFGLTSQLVGRAQTRPQLRLVTPATPRPSVPSWGDEDDTGAFTGYGFPTTLAARSLSAGDLVLVQEDEQQWGVLEDDPMDDLEDEGYLALSWRSDDDDCGVISVPSDASLTVRRPVEFGDDVENEGESNR
jgi:S-DNA-T family DNA segregation ATPase FtsK/SpoIIIE